MEDTTSKHGSSVNSIITIKTAWLVTWEWDSCSGEMSDKIAGIFNYRMGEARIIQIMNFIFHQSNSNLAEIATYAKYPHQQPYKPYSLGNGQLICGQSCNPYLLGRKVEQLIVRKNDEDVEVIEWDELPIHTVIEDRFIQKTNKQRKTYTRTVDGPLSVSRK